MEIPAECFQAERAIKVFTMTKKKFLKALILLFVILAVGYIVSGYGFYLFKPIDETLLANIEGYYSPMDDDLSWMVLTIEGNGGSIMDEGPGKSYFAIYDAEAGNPGVEGRIIYLDENTIIIKIARRFFEELPDSEWETTYLNSRLEMHYTKSGDKLILENNGKELEFSK